MNMWNLTLVAAPTVSIQESILKPTSTVVVFVHLKNWHQSYSSILSKFDIKFHADDIFHDDKWTNKTLEYGVIFPEAVESLLNHVKDSTPSFTLDVRVALSSQGFSFVSRLSDDGAINPESSRRIERYQSMLRESPNMIGKSTASEDVGAVHWLAENFGMAVFSAIPTIPLDPDGSIRPFPKFEVNSRLLCSGLILAELETELEVGNVYSGYTRGDPYIREVATVRGLERIFASYAREDLWAVESVASVVEALRLAEFRWDLRVLRSGDVWSKRILREIRKAGSFQLFWSDHAAQSIEVQKEWMYAHELKRRGFIKPVYWEDPMPVPPVQLSGLHFSRISLGNKM